MTGNFSLQLSLISSQQTVMRERAREVDMFSLITLIFSILFAYFSLQLFICVLQMCGQLVYSMVYIIMLSCDVCRCTNMQLLVTSILCVLNISLVNMFQSMIWMDCGDIVHDCTYL